MSESKQINYVCGTGQVDFGRGSFCLWCVHYRAIGCDAFPEGIPLAILRGDVDHFEPYWDEVMERDDRGIQFELDPKQKERWEKTPPEHRRR